jgi:hypothetical protein
MIAPSSNVCINAEASRILSVPTIIRYLEAVERLDPSIVRDAVAELNRNEYALGRISGRYH